MLSSSSVKTRPTLWLAAAVALLSFSAVGTAARAAPTKIESPRELEKLARDAQLDALASLRDKELTALVEKTRALAVPNFRATTSAIPLAIEVFARTKEADTDTGKKVVARLRKMWREDRIAFADRSEMASAVNATTTPDDAGNKPTSSRIRLNFAMVKAPSTIAATLAHEGMHAVQHADGRQGEARLLREIEAHKLGNRVWTQLGRPIDAEKNSASEDHETTANAFAKLTEDQVALRIALAYTNTHWNVHGTEYVKALAGDGFPEARRYRILCNASNQDVSLVGIHFVRDASFDPSKPAWKWLLGNLARSRNDRDFQVVFGNILRQMERQAPEDETDEQRKKRLANMELVRNMFSAQARDKNCPFQR